MTGLVIDRDRARVFVDGKEIDGVSMMEYRLLLFLEDSKKPQPSWEILEAVWDGYGNLTLVPVMIFNLRRRLGESGSHPRFIRSSSRRGYWLDKGE